MIPTTLARYIFSLQPKPIALRVNAEDFEEVVRHVGVAQWTPYGRTARFCGVDIEMVGGLLLPEPVYSRL